MVEIITAFNSHFMNDEELRSCVLVDGLLHVG